jgi:hypothetical protein
MIKKNYGHLRSMYPDCMIEDENSSAEERKVLQKAKGGMDAWADFFSTIDLEKVLIHALFCARHLTKDSSVEKLLDSVAQEPDAPPGFVLRARAELDEWKSFMEKQKEAADALYKSVDEIIFSKDLNKQLKSQFENTFFRTQVEVTQKNAHDVFLGKPISGTACSIVVDGNIECYVHPVHLEYLRHCFVVYHLDRILIETCGEWVTRYDEPDASELYYDFWETKVKIFENTEIERLKAFIQSNIIDAVTTTTE